MSTPKLIRVLSPGSKSQNNKQTCCTQAPPDRSSLDTVIMNQKTSQMENYYSLLIEQVKRLSRDNDRMWKLLSDNQDQHNECNKSQKKLKQNLQCAQKQLSMMKEMYSVQKTNFQHSKIFFQKRQQQWQGIVSQLKKVIQDYEETNTIDVNRASQIFNQTTELKSPKPVDRLPNFDKELSIYSRRHNEEEDTQRNEQMHSDYHQQSNIKQSDIKWKQNYTTQRQNYGPQRQNQSCSIMSNSSRKHRSKLFRSKNFIDKINSNNKINNNTIQSITNRTSQKSQKLYRQEMTKFEYFGTQHNPENVYELLTIEDIFQRSLRKTYIKHRNEQQMAFDILNSPHMDKLKNAKSSTKERLNKTIRKVFDIDSAQQLQDVIKYIQEKVYKKYHLLKGELIYKFLEDRFRQCEQVFEASNSALDRLDREPSDFINGVTINSKFRDFQQKRKQIRSNDSKSLRAPTLLSPPVDKSKNFDCVSNSSSMSNSRLGGLSINSHIKDKNNLPSHLNNHMKGQLQKKQKQQREHSQKNIYTEKRISRRNFVEQLSKSNKSISSKIQSSRMSSNKNLSSLIGASQQYQLTPVSISNKGYFNQTQSKGGIYNNRTTDYSRM